MSKIQEAIDLIKQHGNIAKDCECDNCSGLRKGIALLEAAKAENAELRRPMEVNGFKVEGMMAVGKELTRLTAGLKKYGRHTYLCCENSREVNVCTCGWSQIEQGLKKKEGE